jgi:threonine aldolase
MQSDRQRHGFASDNTAGICPEAWTALEQANADYYPSYGEDRWTQQLTKAVGELFETECSVQVVFNGTAANALALAALCQSFHSVICHQLSHIQTDECGAPEFFSKGGRLVGIGGEAGKIDLDQAAAIITEQHGVHSHKPRAISITQATELGTVYQREEIERVCEFAGSRNMFVHMDGARFANAIASLRCAPKSVTWELGVDALCFGGTKNGLSAGELVIFFKRELAHEFDYRAKQGGQLASKTRFLAAPWIALLTDNLWVRNAEFANNAAATLSKRLQVEAGLHPIFPVEANAVFLRLSNELVAGIQTGGWQFYKFVEPDVYRLMCSWATTEKDIEEFVTDVTSIVRQ